MLKIIMRKLQLILLFSIFPAALPALGQKAYTLAVATHHLNFGAFENMGEWQPVWAPAKVMFGIPITEKLAACPAASLGTAGYGLPKDRLFWNIDANLKYDLTQTRFQPYVLLGYGVTQVQEDNYERDFYAGTNVGMGINYWLNYHLGFTLQESYTVLPGYHNYHQLALGIVCRILQGPPDCDKDGFLDDRDECPGSFGTVHGCPDRDNDGVADSEDACPDIFGPVAVKGCPDKDGDGITDDQDQCPGEAGKTELNGCPDSDGDGVINANDACPNDEGTALTNGCPDKDHDQIPDKDDACPSVAGTPALNGCPDQDGDGVADREDNCPDDPGLAGNHGCPPVKKEEVERIEKELSMQAVSIRFAIGKSVLHPASFPSLDKVVKLMNEYPFSKFRVEGHTDDSGNRDKNIALSQHRAEAIKQYFISKGIEGDRIHTQGYGPDRPIAENKSATGRAKNRRSEIHPDNGEQ